ncbi:unnamed protein product [Cylindrotheca closterium]|uniref:Uncharacterized protein n=1 Tax=Cylindrotheca closterium TaxID=2856 RepID=A0AAD2FY23_9STRA|nr:unnamed protein product [Cylindrotheca closterium]
MNRTSMSSPNSISSSPVTVLSVVSPLDEQLVTKCQQHHLELDCSSSSIDDATAVTFNAWELPILEKEEESNHLVQNILDDLQHAQESGSLCQLCEAWNALGLIRLHTRRNPAGALECHALALRLIACNGDEDCMKKATTLSDMGLCYERLQQTKEAVLAYKQAMDLMKGTSSSHPQKMSLERTMARLTRT